MSIPSQLYGAKKIKFCKDKEKLEKIRKLYGEADEIREHENYQSIPEQMKETGPVRKQKKRNKKMKKPKNEKRNKFLDQTEIITPDKGVRSSFKREVDIDAVVKYLKQRYSFLCIGGKALYAFTGKYYEDISDKNTSAAVFKEFLSEETNRLIRDYTEIQRQLFSDREIWYSSMSSVTRNRDVVVFENGTYDILEQTFYHNDFREEDYVFSIIHFDYDPEDMTNSKLVDYFVDQFCNGDCKKRKLLYEIVGFCLSNYENKKACFYFLGVPDSGKSTLCRFLETAVGEDAYISVAIKQLNGKFVSGDLADKKICADEDVAVRTPLKSEDVSIIKKITSSDKIRTDTKYQQPGQLHPECKLVWAGNGMLNFETSEDLRPLINRMVIFPLEEAVPEEQRDTRIVEKLLAGRNYIISQSLMALHDLVANDFKFTKVVHTEVYFSSTNFISGIDQFVDECCILNEGERETTAALYETYKNFCSLHPEYRVKSENPFSTYLEEKFGLKSFNNGRCRGKIGIKICGNILRTDTVG